MFFFQEKKTNFILKSNIKYIHHNYSTSQSPSERKLEAQNTIRTATTSSITKYVKRSALNLSMHASIQDEIIDIRLEKKWIFYLVMSKVKSFVKS